MKDTIFVKPAPGRKVRYPDKDKYLPDEGATVLSRDLFWQKRIQQGDVLVATPGKAVKKTEGGK